MESFSKFEEKLLEKHNIYNILQDKHISDEQYKHVQNVWNTFNLKTVGEYHDLYLKSDILLLLMYLKISERPVWNITYLTYVIISQLQEFMGCYIKMTDIKSQLMTDMGMFQFIEKESMVESHILLTDIQKQITSTRKTTMLRNHENISRILMPIICMDG